MNVHSYMLSILETTKESHYEKIVEIVDSMLRDIDELMEDPLFINNIHGEQELSLDQAIELLSNIRVQFLPDDLIQNRFKSQVFNAFTNSDDQSDDEGISIADLYQLGIIRHNQR